MESNTMRRGDESEESKNAEVEDMQRQVPEDHKICPRCGRMYGFVHCRITDSRGNSYGLGCAETQNPPPDKDGIE